jgi:bleomycin hydrolase
MVNKLTHKLISNFSHKFNKNKTNKIIKNINTKTDLKNVLLKSDYVQDKKKTFTNIIDVQSKISDQKQSGRCWIFAFLNIIRYKMIKKYKLAPDFEFSQNYLFFFDKLEKANYYLSYIIDTYDVNIETILSNEKVVKLVHTLDNLTDDGGRWNVFVNLIEKYGIIPKTNMNDNFHSMNSEELKNFYNDFLRKCSHKIKTTPKNELIKNRATLLNNMLLECYKILVIFLGEPPTKITWEYYEDSKDSKNKTNRAKIIRNISPLDFYKKYVPYCAKNKICLINYPCKEAPFFKQYDVEMSFDVLGEKRRGLINVPIDYLIDATKKSIDNQEAVWVGLDVDKYISHKNSVMDAQAFDYDSIFGFNNAMNKCDSLNYRQTAPVHAMVIKGYNFNNSKTNGFLVENSWGDKMYEKDDSVDYDGNYYMSESWFKDFTFQIVIDKKYAPKKVLSLINQKPILLPYWSPFSALLRRKSNYKYD